MTIDRPTSRRGLLRRAGLALVAASVLGRRAAAEDEVPESEKIKKTDALYQDHPKGEQRCEICLQFNPPGRCKIVQGPISPHGWCQYFAARENAR